MGKYAFCAPAKYGTATGAAVGLVVWALVAWVPAFHNGVPEPVVAFLPFALAWLGHTAATWIAPHPAGAAPAAAALPGSGGGSIAGATGTPPGAARAPGRARPRMAGSTGGPANAAPGDSTRTVRIIPPGKS